MTAGSMLHVLGPLAQSIAQSASAKVETVFIAAVLNPVPPAEVACPEVWVSQNEFVMTGGPVPVPIVPINPPIAVVVPDPENDTVPIAYESATTWLKAFPEALILPMRPPMSPRAPVTVPEANELRMTAPPTEAALLLTNPTRPPEEVLEAVTLPVE